MKKMIILGRSPFVAKVRLSDLKYELGCINMPPCKVHYCFCIDGVKFPVDNEVKIISPQAGYSIIPAPNFDKKKKDVLGFYRFTVSSAINWCYLNDYTHIYLVGVDHNENDQYFLHNNGSRSYSRKPFQPYEHKNLKHFIYQFKDRMNIFQTNPDTSWDLEYVDIKSLYK